MSRGARMVHQEVAGSRLGRSIFPLLLILIPLVADAGIMGCQPGSCPATPTFSRPQTRDPGTGARLDFPFPPGSSFTSGQPGSLSLEDDPGIAEDPEAGVEEPVVAESTQAAPRSNARSAPVASSQPQPAEQVDAPAVAGPPAIPYVPPATSGERATRHYRSYSPPPDRRTYSHPDAGSAGSDSSFAPSTASRPATSTPSSSSLAPAPPPSPAPPPPGSQGRPGSFAPGEPGDPAGFIG